MRRLSPAERLDWLRLARTENVGPVTFDQLIARRKVELKLAKDLQEIDRSTLADDATEVLRIEARANARVEAENAASRAILEGNQKMADEIGIAISDVAFLLSTTRGSRIRTRSHN